MRNLKKLVALLTISVPIFAVSQVAHADTSAIYPSTPTDATYYCRPSTSCGSPVGNSPMYITVGSGEFNDNQVDSKVFSNSITYSVTIIEAAICGTAQNDGFYAVQPVDIVNTSFSTGFQFLDKSGAVVQTQVVGASCASRNRSYSITLPASSYDSSSNRYIGYIRAYMINPSAATNENSFRFVFSGAEGGIGSPVAGSTFNFSNRNINSSWVHDVSVIFAPSCESPPVVNGTIEVYDIDNGLYQGTGSYPTLTYYAYARSREIGGSGGWSLIANGNLTGGNSTSQFLPFTYQNNLEYKLEVHGLSRPNAFSVRFNGIVVESSPATFSCASSNTAPTGSLTLPCTNGTVTIQARGADTETNTLTLSGTIAAADNRGGTNIAVTGSLAVTGGAAAADFANESPGTFLGIFSTTPRSVSLTVTDSGGLTATITGSYTCPNPPPQISCNGAVFTAGSAIEPGETYYPRLGIIYTATTGGLNVTPSVTFSSSVGSRTVSGALANGQTRVYGIAGDPSPGVNYGAPGGPFSFPSPGTYPVTVTATWNDGLNPAGSCTFNVDVQVVGRPFFKVLGGDVLTYGPLTHIRGWNQAASVVAYSPAAPCAPFNWTGRCGTAVDGMVIAAGITNGVKSNQKESVIGPLKYTTLSNTVGDPSWGGAFGTPNFAAPVYTTAGAVALAPGSWAGNPNVPANTRVTYTVAGNLRITGNVVYAPAAFGNLSSLPHIRVLVSGDIYIDPSVTQLDGEYIATGAVYTCHSAAWSVPIAANQYIYGTCATPLTVNGALIGSTIKLTRTAGTLRAANGGDVIWNGSSYPSQANVAELIKFTPEIYLSAPGTTPTFPAGANYDSIVSLPPLL